MKSRSKTIILLALVALLTFALFVTGVGCLFSAPIYYGPKTAHFDGERFYNQDRTQQKGFWDFLKWTTNRNKGPWQGDAEAGYGPKPPRQVAAGELRVTFVNHATVLVQIDGLNILTDPIWSERSSPVTWAGPKRVRPPGLRFEDLPPIHAVLVSHNHYDHLDVPTLRRLSNAHGPRMISGLGNAKLMRNKKIGNASGLDWWQAVRLSDSVRVTFVPAQHFSARGLFDHHNSLWGGFVVEGTRHRVYFAGDTGFGPHFEQIRERFGPISMALLPIGAYKPRWFMSGNHLSPQDAIRAHQVLAAARSMVIHFGTFKLGDDGEEEPVEELLQVMKKTGLTDQEIWVLGFGEGRLTPNDQDRRMSHGST